MPSDRKSKRVSRVQWQLMLSILLAIVLSWVLSASSAYYMARQNILAIRQQMLARPDLYPHPIPEPRFRLTDFLIGVQPSITTPPQGRAEAQPPPDGMNPPDGQNPPPDGMGAQPQPGGDPNGGPPDTRPPTGAPPRASYAVAVRALVLRSVITLLLALSLGVLLARRFTRPLQALAAGAKAYQARDFEHRIPAQGEDEFGEVAAALHDMAGQVSQHIAGLEDDAHRRRQLLADVAHELRGPVMTMRTMSGALAEGLANEPERRDRAVQSLVRASDRMLHLVTDLLELAKLDLRELPIHPQPVDLRELATHTLHAHATPAAEAGIHLPPVPDGPPLLAQADPDRLAQVLDNLIDNAISYAGADAVVSVELDAGPPIRLRVRDTGRGIAAQHLPYLFDPFYRVDTVRNTHERHSGLGLRIARALIEAQGGTLTLTSRPGSGTTVEITLPTAEERMSHP